MGCYPYQAYGGIGSIYALLAKTVVVVLVVVVVVVVVVVMCVCVCVCVFLLWESP